MIKINNLELNTSKGKFYLRPLNELYNTYCMRALKQFFEHIDSDLENYLGLPKRTEGLTELNSAVQVLLLKEQPQHKYWLIADSYYNTIGIMYLYDLKINYQKANIAYGLLAEYRNKGLMQEILKASIEVLSNVFNLIRIGAEIETDNLASLKLIKKLKEFNYEGTCHNYWGPDVTCDIYAYYNKNTKEEL